MKKKILALIATVVMIFTMVGCTNEGVELVKQLEKVAAWDASSMKGNVEVTLKVQGQNVKVNADYEAYTNDKDLQASMTVSIKTIEVMGQKLDLTKDPYKISPVKMYVDGMKFYVSTSYITDLCKIAGVKPEEVMDVSKEYVALDMNDMLTQMGMTKEEITKSSKTDYSVYTNSKIELPIKQDGQVYTVELTSDQMIDAFFGFVNESVANNKELLTATYKKMGLTDEQIKTMLDQVAAVYGDETKAMIKPMLAGSTAKASYTFAEDKYAFDVTGTLKLAIDKDNTIEIGIAGKSEAAKAEAKAVEFPTSVKVYSMQDIISAATAEAAQVTTEADKVATEATK